MKKTVLAAAAVVAIVASGGLVEKLTSSPSFAAGPQTGAESANIAAGGEAYGADYSMFLVMCRIGDDKRLGCAMHEMVRR